MMTHFKRIAFLTILFMLFAVHAGAMDKNRNTSTWTIFSAEEIAKSGTAYSDIIDVSKAAGRGSLHITLTGSGTGKFEIVCSNDITDAVTDYVTPNGVSDIVTAFTVGTGIYTLDVPCVERIVIKVTETSTTDSITITSILAIQ